MWALLFTLLHQHFCTFSSPTCSCRCYGNFHCRRHCQHYNSANSLTIAINPRFQGEESHSLWFLDAWYRRNAVVVVAASCWPCWLSSFFRLKNCLQIFLFLSASSFQGQVSRALEKLADNISHPQAGSCQQRAKHRWMSTKQLEWWTFCFHCLQLSHHSFYLAGQQFWTSVTI